MLFHINNQRGHVVRMLGAKGDEGGTRLVQGHLGGGGEDCEEHSRLGAVVRGSFPPELGAKVASVKVMLCSVTLTVTGDSGLASGDKTRTQVSYS